MRPVLRIPIYDAAKDGNVFIWLISAAEDYRNIRKRERYVALEKLTDTHSKNEHHFRNQRV